MTPFTTLTSVAIPMPEDNVDTDIIFPARFLLITARDGLGRYAFHDRRVDAEGRKNADYVLNKEPWRNASILIAGTNFGSGSSREQAVWALLGQGITCVVAPSFGEIFYGNCFRNGVLPIVLPDAVVASLLLAAQQAQTFTIDLEAKTLSVEDGDVTTFEVGKEHRLALLNGWDETELILNARGDEIAAFEIKHTQAQPWLFETGVSA